MTKISVSIIIFLILLVFGGSASFERARPKIDIKYNIDSTLHGYSNWCVTVDSFDTEQIRKFNSIDVLPIAKNKKTKNDY